MLFPEFQYFKFNDFVYSNFSRPQTEAEAILARIKKNNDLLWAQIFGTAPTNDPDPDPGPPTEPGPGPEPEPEPEPHLTESAACEEPKSSYSKDKKVIRLAS